jgi:hypothetical protein
MLQWKQGGQVSLNDSQLAEQTLRYTDILARNTHR